MPFVPSKHAHMQVFEDLYRETHGLPPRKKRTASIRGSSIVDTERSGDEQDEETGVVAGGEAEEETPAVEGEDGGLADDSDVARLLAELQANFDTDGSDSEAGESGVDGEAPEVATGKENEQAPAPADGCLLYTSPSPRD